MDTKQIIKCEACPAHDLSPMTEDGEQYLQRIWQIVADADDGTRWVHFHDFHDGGEAVDFADKVVFAGCIHTKFWMDVTPTNHLPDYVLDPFRPEFN